MGAAALQRVSPSWSLPGPAPGRVDHRPRVHVETLAGERIHKSRTIIGHVLGTRGGTPTPERRRRASQRHHEPGVVDELAVDRAP